MNKDLTKAIMKRTKLGNNYLKNKCDANRKAYNGQRNLCVSFVRKAKLDYYNRFNHKKVSDNKTFWKTVNPFLTDIGVNHDRILLAEENETISDNDEISEKLNIDDPILIGKEKFKNHQSIQLIKYHYENKNTCSVA